MACFLRVVFRGSLRGESMCPERFKGLPSTGGKDSLTPPISDVKRRGIGPRLPSQGHLRRLKFRTPPTRPNAHAYAAKSSDVGLKLEGVRRTSVKSLARRTPMFKASA